MQLSPLLPRLCSLCARSWSISICGFTYEEAARQLLEQAPHSLEYVPDPMELEDHVPVYIPEPEHPEDLVPAEDEMRDVASSLYHSLHPSGTPPLLPIPLPAPSTSRRADIPEADTPPRKRLLLTTPRPGCEVGESSAAAAARQPGPTMAHRVDCSFVDTMEDQVAVRTVRAKIEVLRRERLAYEQESMETCQALARTGAGCTLLTHWRTLVAVPRLWHMALTGILRDKGSVRDLNVLLESALTWWNSHVMTVTHDVAYSMTWVDLRKKMTDKYCPRNEMKKLEAELWNLKVIGTDVVKYNQRFQELALLCVRMFPEESDKIESSEAIEMATELMDKRVSTIAERQAENKRKFENTSQNNQNQQQQQNKRQNTGQAYTAGNSDRKSYAGSKPLCSKCNYNHEGPCLPKCSNCKRVGHLAKDCRSRPANANNNNRNNNNNNQKGNGCYECGAQGHFRRNCLKLRNNDRGNQAGNDRAPAKVYVVENAGANPDNVQLGSFDAIIGMDWLAKYSGLIVCAEMTSHSMEK
ncbi:putative reverse transcriptase domain-containing protein [Tanacetum coccineum]